MKFPKIFNEKIQNFDVQSNKSSKIKYYEQNFKRKLSGVDE